MADYFPEVRPVPALRARVHARHGRWAEALAWAGERGLSVEDDPDYLREFEHVTLARALVAGTRPTGRALASGGVRAPRAPAGCGRGRRPDGERLECWWCRRSRAGARRHARRARRALQRALALAEPRGYVRVFLDEGRADGRAADGRRRRRARPGYARLLWPPGHGREPPAASGGLIDPLSARELDVLRLLGTDLDGPDIARALFVSVNTVRTHTKNIYAKLGVNNRRAAVRRGDELRLLPRSGDERAG